MAGYWDLQKGVEHVVKVIGAGLVRVGINDAGKLTVQPQGGQLEVLGEPPTPAAGPLNVKWATNPNTPYVGGAVISNLAMFDMVMINVQDTAFVTINLPAADASNAGHFFMVTNLNDKSANPNGKVHFVPDGSDRATQRQLSGITAVWDPDSDNAVAGYSDGQGTWHMLGASINRFTDI